jgi:hypothetical protein
MRKELSRPQVAVLVSEPCFFFLSLTVMLGAAENLQDLLLQKPELSQLARQSIVDSEITAPQYLLKLLNMHSNPGFRMLYGPRVKTGEISLRSKL